MLVSQILVYGHVITAGTYTNKLLSFKMFTRAVQTDHFVPTSFMLRVLNTFKELRSEISA